jgi:aldehyde dehydrogenase (NAD(P)+)
VTELTSTLARLRGRRDAWATLPIADKCALLRRCRDALGTVAEAWVAASVSGKGLDPASPWVGEEWVLGPWTMAYGFTETLDALEALHHGRLLDKCRVTHQRGDRLAVEVYPSDVFESLLVNGLKVEVWQQPGVTRETLGDHLAAFYKQPQPDGALCVVLGAGNVGSIPVMDAVYKLFVEGKTVLIKMNPVNTYLTPYIAQIFAPLIDAGFLDIVEGGADIGASLTQHPDVDEVHITGSARTHDAIVYGDAAAKAADTPRMTKPISSELGGVCPVIVVPGDWTEADLRYQAEHIVTMRNHNGGFNCVAMQVIVLPRGWPLAEALLREIRALLRSLPERPAYYPGAASRAQAALDAHPNAEVFGSRVLVTNLEAEQHAHMFVEETFCSVQGQVWVEGDTPETYLRNAVAFCNDKLTGTLACSVLIDPATQRKLGSAFDQAIADLRYGCIGINIWGAFGFMLPQATWGAYPGHTLRDIGSGIGVVRNAWLFDKPEKSVARAPFRPMPRAWRHGDLNLMPTPLWFVTHANAPEVGRRVTNFSLAPGWSHIPALFLAALRDKP